MEHVTEVAYAYGSRLRLRKSLTPTEVTYAYGSHVRLRKSRTPTEVEYAYGSRRVRKSRTLYGSQNSILTTEVDFRKCHFFFVVNRNWFHGSPLP